MSKTPGSAAYAAAVAQQQLESAAQQLDDAHSQQAPLQPSLESSPADKAVESPKVLPESEAMMKRCRPGTGLCICHASAMLSVQEAALGVSCLKSPATCVGIELDIIVLHNCKCCTYMTAVPWFPCTLCTARMFAVNSWWWYGLHRVSPQC